MTKFSDADVGRELRTATDKAYGGLPGGVMVGLGLTPHQTTTNQQVLTRVTRFDLGPLELGERANRALNVERDTEDTVMHRIVAASNVPFYTLLGIPD